MILRMKVNKNDAKARITIVRSFWNVLLFFFGSGGTAFDILFHEPVQRGSQFGFGQSMAAFETFQAHVTESVAEQAISDVGMMLRRGDLIRGATADVYRHLLETNRGIVKLGGLAGHVLVHSAHK